MVREGAHSSFIISGPNKFHAHSTYLDEESLTFDWAAYFGNPTLRFVFVAGYLAIIVKMITYVVEILGGPASRVERKAKKLLRSRQQQMQNKKKKRGGKRKQSNRKFSGPPRVAAHRHAPVARAPKIDKESNKRPKAVRFCPRTLVRIVPTLDQYTLDEIERCWVLPEDEEESKDHIFDTGIAMRRGDNKDNIRCDRGLEELRSLEARNEVKERKRAVIWSVLEEQERQKSTNIIDDVRIAIASSRESTPARNKALVMAASDAAYVRRNEISFFTQILAKKTVPEEDDKSLEERQAIARVKKSQKPLKLVAKSA